MGTKEKTPDYAVNDLDYSWRVQANNKGFNDSIKKKGISCWQWKKHEDNRIKTSKYTILTFLPMNLYEQYQRGEVVYFTLIFILQCISIVSTMPFYAMLVPLLCIIIPRCIRDLITDIACYRNDSLINNMPCMVLKGQSFKNKKWKDIQVGEIVCLQKDDFVPADMVLLRSTEATSFCYVETAGIDGETNLKLRQSLMVTHCALQTEKALSEFDGLVTCEAPNMRLHTFVGNLKWKGQTYPLNNDNILLRNYRIRNTEKCYGLVIYAAHRFAARLVVLILTLVVPGFDTKIMKNSGKITLKKTNLEFLINKTVFCTAVMLVVMSFIMGILAGVWDQQNLEKHNYIPGHPGMSSSFLGFLLFWGYFASMSTLVPFLLYISLEMIHVIHNFFIDNDIEMYNAMTDIPAYARAARLNDLLGQVEYVFTDKTGTLTQNVMTFKKCCIVKKIFGTTSDAEGNKQAVSFAWNKYADMKFRFYDQSLIDEVCKDEDPAIREFFRLIAICHTVMVDEKEGNMTYQAASPDEEALVTAARNFGYVFLARSQNTVTISELGTVRTYDILAVMDFTSERKRMSILVRDQEGRIKLYTKGADSVILQRLHPDCSSDNIMDALDIFSEDTLRTLCLAYKEVEEPAYEQWKMKHQEASISLKDREACLEKVYNIMENNMQLLGATAIEDKLQDGVPETIQCLRDGNIKVWMLTGDKQETAVNIAYSCNLITSDMEILDESEIRHHMDNLLEITEDGQMSWKGMDIRSTGRSWNKKAIVLTGDHLSKLLDCCGDEPKVNLLKKLWSALRRKNVNRNQHLKGRALVELASQCQSVICCRVTPNQKAKIVQLVKSNLNVTTLSIGDGGNDVNMIKTAHIGVGISGNEGPQAALASDYSFAQFSFLRRLLFVHGRLSCFRLTKYLNFYIYKTYSCLISNYWFAFYNGFSALPTFDTWFLVFNSIFYTLTGALYLGIMDKDVDIKTSLLYPELYLEGQRDRHRGRRFMFYAIYGIYTSLTMFFIAYGAFLDSAGPNGIFDYQVFICTVTIMGIIAVLTEAAIQFSSWSVFAVLSLAIGLGWYFLISYLTGTSFAYFTSMVDFNNLGAFVNTISSGYIWLLIPLAVIVNIIPSLFLRPWQKFAKHSLIKSRSDLKANKVNKTSNNVMLQSAIRRGSSRRRSSYAFSHCEGYGKIITRT